MQLTACQCRFQHIARVHGTIGFASAYHGVNFIDKQDDRAFLLGELVQYRFQAFFELAAELGTSNQGAHVQRQNALVFETLRHFAVHDSLGKSFDDRGLANPGLTDQHRVVFGPSLQHLNGSANFTVSANHRIQVALLGSLGDINAIFLQRLKGVLSTSVSDFIAAAQVANRVFQCFFTDAEAVQQFAHLALV